MKNKKYNIKVVIGASFGDEGKGLMTDKFCHESKDLVLNIRYNGGFQASHTVVTPEGERHIFNGIGAGMLNKNVSTYFDREFIINPAIMLEEYRLLGKHMEDVKVYVSRHCAITTPFDMMLNIARETQRGENSHGSCGIGIYETFRRNQFPEYELRVGDILEGKEHLKKRLNDIGNKYMKDELRRMGLTEKQKDIELGVDTESLEDTIYSISEGMAEELMELKKYFIVLDNEDILLDVYTNLVFEGAQGLMLDRNNTAYAPHLTPSNTGLDNVVAFLKRNKITNKMADIEVCYVSRSYNTRHGAGFLMYEVKDKSMLGEKVEETTNTTNQFQKHFRFGYLNLEAISYCTRKDFQKLKRWRDAKASICFTHMDQTDGLLVTKNERVLPEDLDWLYTQFYKVYVSRGMTRNDVTLY